MPMTLLVLILALLVGLVVSQEDQSTKSPYALPFEVPEWIAPDDKGGKLPFFPSDELSVVECPQEVKDVSSCELPGDSQGVFVCRRVGVVPLSICTPNIMAADGTSNVLGFEGDTCGCCGEECPQTCTCECNDGRGILIETFLIRWWHVSMCIPRGIADYVAPLRKEIRCGTCDSK